MVSILRQSAQAAAHATGALARSADREVSCGTFDDVPGLIADVVAGVAQGRFNDTYLEFLAQVSLARLLLGAVLHGRWRGDRLIHSGWYLLSIRTGGRTRGCALVRSSVDERGPVIDLSLVAVRADARHQGLGAELVRQVLQRAEGRARVRCTCAAGAREMIALVQKLGFRRTQVGRILTGGVRRPDEFTYQRPTSLTRVSA